MKVRVATDFEVVDFNDVQTWDIDVSGNLHLYDNEDDVIASFSRWYSARRLDV